MQSYTPFNLLKKTLGIFRHHAGKYCLGGLQVRHSLPRGIDPDTFEIEQALI